jgi:DNA helicase IV
MGELRAYYGEDSTLMESRQPGSPSPEQEALAHEQARVSAMYARLDELREYTAEQLAAAHLQERGGFAALVEREARSYEQARRRARLGAVEEGLCFGRVDLAEDAETHYIGRIGLRDAEHETMLVDWRAPAARPFYAATPSDPVGLTRRRHLRVRRRRVVGLDDEVFDPDGLTETDRRQLVGEAALLASLRRGRTGRMADIVATIQAEQDRVIRARLAGVLVVQGGPGTGKTVAALHRAAYLLYTHRHVLERRGVLVVGPNPAFLRYVGDVLPSLGETDVVMRTVGELFPGIRAQGREPHAVARVKGSPRMADLVRAAILDRQRTPLEAFGDAELRVETDAGVLTVPADTAERVIATARGLRLPHNAARKYAVTTLLTELARSEGAVLGRAVDESDLPFVSERLWFEAPVRAAIDALWPPLTPERLLDGLFSDPAAVERVGARADLAGDERRALVREPGAPWTVEDVPLLDEAADLLGYDDSAERARARRRAEEEAEEERYAQGVLEFTGAGEDDPLLDARVLAERHRDTGPGRTTAERAGEDREWTYGHVIVDEAQELSPMAWRAVMRRVPTRSLTVVGDIAQTGSAAGAQSWTSALAPFVGTNVHVERLRVNYRTPAPIMAAAADVLRAAAPDEELPESVREEGDPPRAVRLAGPLAETLPGVVAEEVRAIGEGRVAVITADRDVAAAAAALPDAGRPYDGGSGRDALQSTVVVLTATEAKGLEFDSVVVVEPDALWEQPRGANDLYVAVTRATRRLTVAHTRDLPGVLKRLSD